MVVPKKKGKREFDVDESVESDHISTYVTMETDDDFTFEVCLINETENIVKVFVKLTFCFSSEVIIQQMQECKNV